MKRIITLLVILFLFACQGSKDSKPAPPPTKEIKLKAWHIPDSLRHLIKPI